MLRTFLAFLLLASLTAGCSTTHSIVTVRGKLIWSDKRQTIEECGSGQTYWVGVYASNPNFFLTRTVQELKKQNVSREIIAELKGNASKTIPSGLSYPVSGSLEVLEIKDIQLGNCN